MSANPSHTLLESIRETMEQSDLLDLLATTLAHGERGVSLLMGSPSRSLTPAEVTELQEQGNVAADWSRVLVTEGFHTACVQGSRFLGQVVLGRFDGQQIEVAPGVSLPTGIYDSTVQDCEIGDDGLIHRVGLLASTLIAPHACVIASGVVAGSGHALYGCDLDLPPGNETAVRRLGVFPEMAHSMVFDVLERLENEDFMVDFESLLEQYTSEATGAWSIIDEGAIVQGTSRIFDSYIGRMAEVNGATTIEHSCVLSDDDSQTEIMDGATVSGSLVQRGARVGGSAVCENSLLAEMTQVDGGAMIRESYVGPGSQISQAEVNSSLLGPMVAAHHQSLLIAVTWRDGHGNVGAGALSGSNHAGRGATESMKASEGLFLGLGVRIKYPANFEEAPHTMVAAGVTTLPQRLEFPYSLVNLAASTHAGVSPAINELHPGWLIGHSFYQLVRNTDKYRQRTRLQRLSLTFDPFSLSSLKLAQRALGRLLEAPDDTPLGPGSIEGIGKNLVTREAVDNGIADYRFLIDWAARKRVAQQVTLAKPGRLETLTLDELVDGCDSAEWQWVREIVGDEGSVRTLLEQFVRLQQDALDRVTLSFQRDSERATHVHAGSPPTTQRDPDADPVIQAVAKDLAEAKALWDSTGT